MIEITKNTRLYKYSVGVGWDVQAVIVRLFLTPCEKKSHTLEMAYWVELEYVGRLFIASVGVKMDRQAVNCGGGDVDFFAGRFVLVFDREAVLCRALRLAKIELAINIGVNGRKRTRSAVSIDPFGLDLGPGDARSVLKEHAALNDSQRAPVDVQDQPVAEVGCFAAANFYVVSNGGRVTPCIKNEVINAGLKALNREFTLFARCDGADILRITPRRDAYAGDRLTF